MPFFKKLFFVNDIQQVDEVETLKKIKQNTNFSISFIVLLVVSTVVTTLGLLQNSSPVVIGGMIISPLMWPLMKIAIGVSYERKSFIRESITLLLLAVGVSLFSSYFITIISPIKLVNSEILARTEPTFLDLIVALAGGGVAAFGIIQPRISESLAGVAIATALMPPICVSGIGLALGNFNISVGGFILFLANVISIIFVSVLIFSSVGIKNDASKTSKLRRRGTLVLASILLLMAIPLFFFLRNYAFRNGAYNEVQVVLEENLNQISPSIETRNIELRFERRNGQEIAKVNAEIDLPEGLSINTTETKEIRNSLEEILNRPVDMKLTPYPVISIITDDDIEKAEISKNINQEAINQLQRIDQELNLENIQISETEIKKDEKNVWDVEMILSADPSVVVTNEQREVLERSISDAVKIPVNLNLTIRALVKLKSGDEVVNQQELQDLRGKLEELFDALESQSETSSIIIQEFEEKVEITVELKVMPNQTISRDQLVLIKNVATDTFEDKEVALTVNVIEQEKIVI